MYSPFFSFLHYVYCKTFHTIIPKVVGGGVLWISSNRDDRRIFLGQENFGKYFFG